MAPEPQNVKPLFTYDDIARIFECPVCVEFATSPILQCQNGHIVCTACQQRLQSCPVCRGQLAASRNLVMEQLAEALLFPCQYAASGCTAVFPLAKKVKHDRACHWRPCACPHPGTACTWEGALEHVMLHLANLHADIKTVPGECVTFIATEIDSCDRGDWATIQSCFDRNFLLILVKRQRSQCITVFFAAVLLIGTIQQAEAFSYKMELLNGQNQITWEAMPISIHDGVQSAIDTRNCLSFSGATALTFTEKGNLTINVTINKL